MPQRHWHTGCCSMFSVHLLPALRSTLIILKDYFNERNYINVLMHCATALLLTQFTTGQTAFGVDLWTVSVAKKLLMIGIYSVIVTCLVGIGQHMQVEGEIFECFWSVSCVLVAGLASEWWWVVLTVSFCFCESVWWVKVKVTLPLHVKMGPVGSTHCKA